MVYKKYMTVHIPATIVISGECALARLIISGAGAEYAAAAPPGAPKLIVCVAYEYSPVVGLAVALRTRTSTPALGAQLNSKVLKRMLATGL